MKWSSLLIGLIALGGVVFVGYDFVRDRPVVYEDVVEHFKYGSIGSEPGGSVLQPIGGLLPPYWVFVVLPKICPTVSSYAEFGLIYEPDHKTDSRPPLPIGLSERRRLGTDMIGVNCALCHAGTVRISPEAPALVIPGLPPQQVDVQGLLRFLFDCVQSPEFTAKKVIAEIEKARGPVSYLERLADRLKYRILIPTIRGKVRDLSEKLGVLTSNRLPASGPGRLDTVNPGKALEVGWNLQAQLDGERRSELIGTADFPSVWNLGARSEMRVHWDGNLGSVHEALISAALAVGAKPQTLDREAFDRVVKHLTDLAPPRYPDRGLDDRPIVTRGKALFDEHCAACHEGQGLGQVTPIEELGTDPHRLNAFSPEFAPRLSVALNRNYAKSSFRFTTFRKTEGYVNVRLDGLWARAPYLHNGSVPTLRDLLQPEECRPRLFYRGSDLYDRQNLGFVSHSVADSRCQRPRAWQREKDEPPPPETGRPPLFRFDTRLPGNWNVGHRFGIDLNHEAQDDLLEFLKTL
jgi:Cytochrome c